MTNNYNLTFITNEVKKFRKTNNAFSKYRKIKKIYL